jgi:hypothetical protein
MKGHLDRLEKVCRCPGMYVREPTYESITAYVQGYDSALGGSLLRGFREWLVMRTDAPGNFV